METQTQLDGLGPPRHVRIATAAPRPECEGFVVPTYLVFGLGRRKWVRYRVLENLAATEHGRTGELIKGVELAGAQIEVRRRWYGDVGTIVIYAQNGQVLHWNCVRKVSMYGTRIAKIARSLVT